MAKKLISLFLIIVLILSFTGCSKKKPQTESSLSDVSSLENTSKENSSKETESAASKDAISSKIEATSKPKDSASSKVESTTSNKEESSKPTVSKTEEPVSKPINSSVASTSSSKTETSKAEVVSIAETTASSKAENTVSKTEQTSKPTASKIEEPASKPSNSSAVSTSSSKPEASKAEVVSKTESTTSKENVVSKAPQAESKPTSSSKTPEYVDPALYQGLLDLSYYTYKRTSVFNDFGERTVLQLDLYNREANMVVPYCLIYPKNYNPQIKYPVLTYLHGAGEMGSDNNSHLSLMVRYCRSYPQFLNDAFIVCPQAPEWWSASGVTTGPNARSLDIVMNILQTLPEYCSIDPNRHYVTGVSMGGFGTFSILEQYPYFFAAGVPICGGGNPETAYRLVNTPLWLFHSRDDNIVSFEGSNSMYNAIKAAGGQKINFTILDGMGHNSWNATEHNDELFRWIFYQSLDGEPALDYTHMLEVRDNNNVALFNEDDFVLSYYGNGKINLLLKEDKFAHLEEITANNKNGVLNIYYEGKSIGQIKIDEPITDGALVFETTLTSTEAVTFCGKI